MGNSSMVSYTKISPNRNSPREAKIKKITIHHMAGNLSLETCGNIFQKSGGASANYGIDSNGNVGMYVEEKDRSWCSSNRENDHQAVTIEVANDGGADTDWHVSDKALATLIELCVDICKRNGIKKLNYTGDKSGNLTRHNMFTATTCPGPYLQSKFSYIAQQVNQKLGVEEESELYRVRKSWADADSQKGAFAVLENAKACADDNPGYSVYDEDGKKLYTDGRWLPPVKNLDDYAGNIGEAITAFAVKVSKGSVWYQAHLANENRWCSKVTGYNIDDYDNGYAGEGKGHPIDAVRIYYKTPSGKVYKQAYYRVSELKEGYMPWQEDDSTKNGMDGYAGNAAGKPIDRLQIQIKARS